jgi:hypothetical protein
MLSTVCEIFIFYANYELLENVVNVVTTDNIE